MGKSFRDLRLSHRRTIYSAVWYVKRLYITGSSLYDYLLYSNCGSCFCAVPWQMSKRDCTREDSEGRNKEKKKGKDQLWKLLHSSRHIAFCLCRIFSFHRRGSAHLFSSFYPLSERPTSSPISGRVLRNNRWVESSASKRAERVDDFGRRSSPQPSTQFKRLSSRLFELSLQFTSTTDDEQVNQPHSNRLLHVWI